MLTTITFEGTVDDITTLITSAQAWQSRSHYPEDMFAADARYDKTEESVLNRTRSQLNECVLPREDFKHIQLGLSRKAPEGTSCTVTYQSDLNDGAWSQGCPHVKL